MSGRYHMRLSLISIIAAVFLLAATIAVVASVFAVRLIEDSSREAVRARLDAEGLGWTEVDSDGLQMFLAGTAPSEAMRFKALSLAGTVVDAARVIDQMLVEEAADLAPPRFAIEILRNDSGISLIGLVPATTDRHQLLADISEATNGAPVADFLDAADYPTPDTWAAALRYAVRSLGELPRAKISVSAERVEVTAMADSGEARRGLETDLARMAPDDVRVALRITAPRPVITPFTLRFVIDEGGARFDACAADSEAARDRILRAAGRAGLQSKVECTVGMGVPSANWARAAELSIAALADLGGGSVTMSDADIALLANEDTEQRLFDTVAGRLEAELPEVFALTATLPEPSDESEPVRPEFVATLSPEGQVLIRGRVGSEVVRDTVRSYAEARFSSEAVHVTARVVEGLPSDWSMRVLTGLEALSNLSNGAVTVTPDSLSLTGHTGRKRASADIAQLLSDQLGESGKYEINVRYRETLDPDAGLPTPEECEAQIAQMQDGRKINFEPGSARIDGQGAAIMDDIAEILKQCGEIRMQIAGHTDSQGREEMNEQLSLDRARAVLDELRLRRVLTSTLEARGYGESRPIADNDTEAGRETNRRIEFRLIRPEPVEDEQTALESLEDPLEEETGTQPNAQDQATE